MAKSKYPRTPEEIAAEEAKYQIPKGFTQCGGPNPEDPGCHRIVKQSHVDEHGFCCFCEDQGRVNKEESASESDDDVK